MSDQTRVLHVRGGIHTTNNIFESTSDATFTSVEPYAEPRLVATVNKLERKLVRGNGHQYARRAGAQVTSLDLEFLVRGLDTPAASTVLAATTGLEIGWLYNSVFGMTASAGTGTTITGSDGVARTIGLTQRSGFPVGNAILFSNGTEMIAREIVASGSGAGDVTVDRDFPGTATGTAYASVSWYLNAANSNHIHTSWDCLGDNWRRKLAGCLGNMIIPIVGGQLLSAKFALQGTLWESATVDGASFSAPAVGEEIKCLAASIFLGDDQYNLIDGEFNLGLAPTPRPTPAGINGFLGFQCKEPTPGLKGKFQFGTLTGEVTDTLLRAMQGDGTYDAAVQIGTQAGAACYIRAPNADFTIDLDKADGFDVASFESMFTMPDAGNGAVRFHLF